MKKYLALVLGVLFVLSFAASAFAIHAEIPSETQAVVSAQDIQITLGGEIRVRGWYIGNDGDGSFAVVDNDSGNVEHMPTIDHDGDIHCYSHHGTPYSPMTHVGADTSATTYYDQRVRLFVDAKLSPNLSGRVALETGNGQTDVYNWGNFNSKPTTMSILESWIMYTGLWPPWFPFRRQGRSYASGSSVIGQFFDHTKFGDDAIVFFMDPTKELHVSLIDIKFSGDGSGSPLNIPLLGLDNFSSGSTSSYSDDLDGYVAALAYKAR